MKHVLSKVKVAGRIRNWVGASALAMLLIGSLATPAKAGVDVFFGLPLPGVVFSVPSYSYYPPPYVYAAPVYAGGYYGGGYYGGGYYRGYGGHRHGGHHHRGGWRGGGGHRGGGHHGGHHGGRHWR